MAKEDEAQDAGAGGAEPKRRLTRGRLLLFVILPLLLLLAGGAGYYFFFMNKKKTPEAAKPPPPKVFVYYNLPSFVVNLPASTAGRTSFLKVTISLELDSAADETAVQAVMPRIVDHVQAYLRNLRPEDLKGTAALTRFKEEMLSRVTSAAPTAKVDDVLLQELLLQ